MKNTSSTTTKKVKKKKSDLVFQSRTQVSKTIIIIKDNIVS